MKNLMILATAIGSLGTHADEIGKATGGARLTALMGVLPVLLPLAKADFKAAKEELKAATPEQKAEVKKALDVAFDIGDDKLEALIEDGIAFIAEASSLVSKGAQLVQDFKAVKNEPKV